MVLGVRIDCIRLGTSFAFESLHITNRPSADLLKATEDFRSLKINRNLSQIRLEWLEVGPVQSRIIQVEFRQLGDLGAGV